MKYLILTALFVTNLYAQTGVNSNYFVYLGGGGEPVGPSTMFDTMIQRTGSFLSSNPNWKPEVAFNGGHSNTENILRTKFPGGHSSFTAQSFERIISDYERKIRSGQIKSGDQVLLSINTHGSKRNKLNGEETHTIAVAKAPIRNYSNFSGGVSLDRLKTLSRLAKEKNIKLGIIDMSCHSGISLALGNENTCVLTASGPDHFGYGDTGFSNTLRSGISLEQAFLEMRSSNAVTAFPMISTKIGRDIQDELYPLISNYLYEDATPDDKFSASLRPLIYGDDISCQELKEESELDKLLRSVERVEAHTYVDFSNLKNSLRDYARYRKRAIGDILRKKQILKNYPKKTICEQGKCSTYSGHSLVQVNQSRIDKLKSFLQGDSGDIEMKKMIRILEKALVEKEKLLHSIPELRSLTQSSDHATQTLNLARRVGKEAVSLYEQMYRARQQNDHGGNPCRDFIL